MIAWTRGRTLLAGMSLIVVVNAAILAGAAYNRAGEPESLLTLSERELRLPYGRWQQTENSGRALHLLWRVPVDAPQEEIHDGDHSFGGTPAWLDEAKMASLGFAVAPDRFGRREQRKEVVLVLELAGSAYGQALARARTKAADEAQLRQAFPENKEFAQRAKMAQDRLEREENKNSRLFVVDAGLEIAALRAQYPDREHYLLLRGVVQPQETTRGKRPTLTGFITRLSIDEIHVPVEWHAALTRTADSAGTPPPLQAAVAFGKRLEPWIVQLASRGEKK